VACMGEGRGVYRVLVGRTEGKRPLERPKSRWKNNIKRDLTEIRVMERTEFDWLRIEFRGERLPTR